MANIFEGKYGAKLEILEGWWEGSNQKAIHGGRVCIILLESHVLETTFWMPLNPLHKFLKEFSLHPEL